MMVAPVGRPGAGGPQQPGSGPMNPNQPGQSTCRFNLKLLHTYCKVFSSAIYFALRALAVDIGIHINCFQSVMKLYGRWSNHR